MRALYRRGKRRRTDHLDVFVAESPAFRARLAVIVPKFGHRIVERNRLKRRMREGVRLELLPRCRECGASVDILVRARAGAYDVEYEVLRRELIAVAEELCSHVS
ncbi:MAG: ribonuclease P protein component [Gemmatimonadota bacterium]|nr:MAG: ribonuclease P protein component [Gemmatimonadota bacterium]